MREGESSNWSITCLGDGANTDAKAWATLDASLIRRCQHSRVTPPLKVHTPDPGLWETFTEEVTSISGFRRFLDACFTLFIDGRAEEEALKRYPYLMLAYHEIRLVRNYFVHGGAKPSTKAVNAWNMLCRRVGKENSDLKLPEEWAALRDALLRKMYAALANAHELLAERR